MKRRTFGEDVALLSRHVDTIVLGEDQPSQIAVVPQYQGRTMTSTLEGNDGESFGWVNESCIGNRTLDPQINLYGGEDRLWLSPEGSQFSIFFDPDAPCNFSNWRTPALIDTEPFEVTNQTPEQVVLTRQGQVTNRAGFTFDVQLDREVALLGPVEAEGHLGVSVAGLNVVAHESRNRLTNVGDAPWRPENGLLSIWVLGMNCCSPYLTVVIPYVDGPDSHLGPVVTSDYFGKLDSSRLVVGQTSSDSAKTGSVGKIFFLGDGNWRSKLGLSHARCTATMGSYDDVSGVLTIVSFNRPLNPGVGYANNLWGPQDEPLVGDAVNAYNDGPNESGKQLGGFYELETLSPALALEPGEGYTHVHRTIRLTGDQDSLNNVCRGVFDVPLHEIQSVFKA